MKPIHSTLRGPLWPRTLMAIVMVFALILTGACSSGGGEAPAPGPVQPQATHYVSTSGSDAAPGTEAQPWRTLQYALQQLEPGDVLVVEDGTYSESIVLSCSGTAGNRITVRARNSGAAILDAGGGSVAVADSGGGPSYLTLEGLVIRNATRGFDLTGAVAGLTVRNCEIRDCRHAFLCRRGSDLRLEDVAVIECYDGIGLGVKGVSGIDGVRIIRCSAVRRSDEEVGDNTDGFRIEGLCTDVRLSDCEGAGFDDSGFDIKPAGAILERCLAHRNWDNGFKLWGDAARMINCIAVDNHDTGVKFPGAAEMYHCTIAFNTRAAFRPQSERIQDIKVYNTIFACNFIRQYIESGGRGVYTGDHNLYYAEPGELIWKTMDDESLRFTLDEVRQGALPLGEHSVFAAPEFISISERDLRLSPASPGIDAGERFPFVRDDFLRHPRDTRPDIGAYER